MRYKAFRKLHEVNVKEIAPALERAGEVDGALFSEADKIRYCGEIINTVQCNDCGTNHFKSFTRCRSKFCSLCQRVKSSLWTMHLVGWLKQWLEQGNYVVFLNLTLKDTDNLQEGLNQLEGAWRLMTTKYRKGFLSLFPGGFKAIEVKTGKNSGQWHPHLHALVLKDRYSKDTNFLHYVWPKCVAEMGGVAVNLKILPFSKQPGESKEAFDVRLAQSVKEVCKYITKFNWKDEKPERLAEMFNALKGKRQYAVWGALTNVRNAVAKDLNTKSNDEVQNFVCQRCSCTVGHPNKLFRAIWDGPDEPIIEDYKISMPETVVSEEEKRKLLVLNRSVQIRQKQDFTEWAQERAKLPDIRHKPF